MASRRVAQIVVALFALLETAYPAAILSEAASEYQIKAAFLFNFLNFVEWPSDANSTTDPLVVCIYGKDPFGASLDKIVVGRAVSGRPLAVRRISGPAAVRSCHLAFFAESEMSRFETILPTLGEASVLTVGEARGFVQHGGIIKLVVQEDRVRFEVNLIAASRAHLKISSKLLRLASTVH